MDRFFRFNKYNPNTLNYDGLLPQGHTSNILRKDNMGILETFLGAYDDHLTNSQRHVIRATATGTSRNLILTCEEPLVDGALVVITLSNPLEYTPTIQYNGSDPAYIVNGNGENIPGGQVEGARILVTWNQPLGTWELLSTDAYQDITKVVLPVLTTYSYAATADGISAIAIPQFNKLTDKLRINYGQTILRDNLDYTFDVNESNVVNLNFTLLNGDIVYFEITSYITTTRRGHYKFDLVSTDYPVTINGTAVTTVDVPLEGKDSHSIEVNYSQTILRNGIDFEFNEDRSQITLLTFTLNNGDIIVFTITNFVEEIETKLPDNWGATGNYRYSLNVVNTSYNATTSNVTIIPVPQYNYKRDSINVIFDNRLYIRDVDYTIDEIGQIVLINHALNVGETIYFTILQGAMMDVPNFNVTRAYGTNGSEIRVNISYNELSDFYTLLIKLAYNLESNPYIKCLDGPAEPIINEMGHHYNANAIAGSYMWVIYDYHIHSWVAIAPEEIEDMPEVQTTTVFTGTANFVNTYPISGVDFVEAVISDPVDVSLKNYVKSISVHPIEPPTKDDQENYQTIGDIWYRYDSDLNILYVGNSGYSTSAFEWNITTISP